MNIILLIIILLIIDSFYISIIKKQYLDFIHSYTSHFTPSYIKASIAYLFLIIALHYFIISRLHTLSYPLFDAFILGLVIYGTFDFTLAFLFNNYNITLAIIDTLWGGTLFLLTTFIYTQVI